jgi:hypothetical protein
MKIIGEIENRSAAATIVFLNVRSLHVARRQTRSDENITAAAKNSSRFYPFPGRARQAEEAREIIPFTAAAETGIVIHEASRMERFGGRTQ